MAVESFGEIQEVLCKPKNGSFYFVIVGENVTEMFRLLIKGLESGMIAQQGKQDMNGGRETMRYLVYIIYG